jgi:antitoxin ParD1/3/4
MTMNVNLSPQLEAMMKAKVASGRYTSASEEVREALRLMEQQDQLRLCSLSSCVATSRTGWQAERRRPGTRGQSRPKGRRRLEVHAVSSLSD